MDGMTKEDEIRAAEKAVVEAAVVWLAKDGRSREMALLSAAVCDLEALQSPLPSREAMVRIDPFIIRQHTKLSYETRMSIVAEMHWADCLRFMANLRYGQGITVSECTAFADELEARE